MTAPLADRPFRGRTLRPRARRPRARSDDRGEGVVSAAIVVLIMAAIGALMWVGFRSMWSDIEADTNERIAEVGN